MVAHLQDLYAALLTAVVAAPIIEVAYVVAAPIIEAA
jgi:hypothetical protein